MPGHKGGCFLGCEARDITEIGGADLLSAPTGIIAKSEENATELFGSAHSFYSTEGSTLAIKAMLALVKSDSEGSPLILAARNAHKAFVYASALLDLRIEWLYPESFSHICNCATSPDALEKKLASMNEKPNAVYITSPDYLGNISDVEGLSAVCDKHGIPLLVDNAHGAYLNFLDKSQHPIKLGAAACCDSAHKTLPVLTGGAYLHISKKAPKSYCENARKVLALFASTSPSYLILQSLDLCNANLANRYRERLSECIKKVDYVKEKIEKANFSLLHGEPLKIVIDAKKSGYTGNGLSELLGGFGIECEFSDPDYLVLMVTPENRDSDFDRLISAFCSISPKAPLDVVSMPLSPAVSAMTVREAIFAKSERVSLCDALGRICAAPTVSCPPAVCVAVSGEIVTAEHIRLLEYYGIKELDVVC